MSFLIIAFIFWSFSYFAFIPNSPSISYQVYLLSYGEINGDEIDK